MDSFLHVKEENVILELLQIGEVISNLKKVRRLHSMMSESWSLPHLQGNQIYADCSVLKPYWNESNGHPDVPKLLKPE